MPGDVLGHPQVVPTTVLNKIVAGLMGGRKETKKRLNKGKSTLNSCMAGPVLMPPHQGTVCMCE